MMIRGVTLGVRPIPVTMRFASSAQVEPIRDEQHFYQVLNRLNANLEVGYTSTGVMHNNGNRAQALANFLESDAGNRMQFDIAPVLGDLGIDPHQFEFVFPRSNRRIRLRYTEQTTEPNRARFVPSLVIYETQSRSPIVLHDAIPPQSVVYSTANQIAEATRYYGQTEQQRLLSLQADEAAHAVNRRLRSDLSENDPGYLQHLG